MKINLHGDIIEGGQHPTGYASHIRNLAKGFIKNNIDLGIESNVNKQDLRLFEPNVVKAIKNHYPEANTISIARPENWNSKISDRPKKFFGYLVFEGSRIPYSWSYLLVKHANDVDCVLVPSNHVKEAIWNAKYTPINRIEVVPEGINTDIFKPKKGKKKRGSPFEFLYVGGWAQGENDRKGLDIALRAYMDEFSSKEDVIFTAKVNLAYAPKDKIIADLKRIGVDSTNPALPEMRFSFDYCDDRTLADLYRNADAFVMPTKAEGFGLTIAEAMACGLPTIATNYGGHLDYFNDQVGYPICVKNMVKATDSNYIYEDAKWAMPDIEDLKDTMRYVYENYSEAKKLGRKASKRMKKYSWEASAKKIIKLLS